MTNGVRRQGGVVELCGEKVGIDRERSVGEGGEIGVRRDGGWSVLADDDREVSDAHAHSCRGICG